VLAAKITIEQEGGLFSREMLRDQPVPPPGIFTALNVLGLIGTMGLTERVP